MSKSSIKTKTVLTMTNMTQSTELQAFKRPKDGYKVTIKISLCICIFYLETNSKSGKIYLIATMKCTCTRTPTVLLVKQNKCVNWKKGR